MSVGGWFIIVKHASGGLAYTIRYMPVADWFIHSGTYASGGLVCLSWNILQGRLGLYIVEYMPEVAWFTQSEIYQWLLGLYTTEYLTVVF
jgi:hypothetical protein